VSQNQSLIYSDGEIELKVSVDGESVWLNRQQIAALFSRDVKTIGKHINNVFKEAELLKDPVVASFATTAKDGKTYSVEYYNLDVIISVGYRVKSQRGVSFRQWATTILKRYISNGNAINTDKITNQRFKEFESDVNSFKSQVNNISSGLKDSTLKEKQGVFYNGQTFDAYLFVADIIKSAEKSIQLIDNYIDETVLVLLSKNQNVKMTIYTQSISKQLKLDIQKYNSQYNNIGVKKLAHLMNVF